MGDFGKLLKKIWHFIWYEDSVWSWIINIIIAFVLIKFIIYPGLGLLLGTNLPIVAVVSESMDHGMVQKCTQCNYLTESCTKYQYEICGQYSDTRTSLNTDEYWSKCGKWYEDRGITKEMFSTYKMDSGFAKGDIILLKGINYDKLTVGDIIVFQSGLPYPIIHRVVKIDDVIQTKGDHNSAQIEDTNVNEKYVTKDKIIGRAWIRIPYLGYVKIWFVDALTYLTFRNPYPVCQNPALG
ncbi:MAG: signal peptidase I [Candidatus Woesearchaeota archaeon]